ncbi:MAG: HEAT repeat domain-containing protein, partial [Gemmataceae bacterium]|nr:HEAT repeat domain-containing protein [Gemmataceae bacterium]
MGRKGGKAIEPLLRALPGSTGEMRAGLLAALRANDGYGAGHAPALSALLKDGDAALRAVGAAGLGKTGAPGALDALLAMLRTEEDADAACTALESLGGVGAGSPEAVAVLEEKAKSKDASVRRAATGPLLALGDLGI